MYMYTVYNQNVASSVNLMLTDHSFSLDNADVIVENMPFRCASLANFLEMKEGAYEIAGFIPKAFFFPEKLVFFLNEDFYYEIEMSKPIKVHIYLDKGEYLSVAIETLLSEVFALAFRGYGLHAFHAGCIDADGFRVLIFGDSGHGKSTLTAGLCSNGATYLSDDLSLIKLDVESGAVLTCGGLEFFKLWKRSSEALNLPMDTPLPYAEGKYLYSAKKIFNVKSDWKAIDLCVCVERQLETIEPFAELVDSMQAYIMLLKAQLSGFALTSEHWAQVRKIAKMLTKKPFYRFQYSNDLAQMNEVSQSLLSKIPKMREVGS